MSKKSFICSLGEKLGRGWHGLYNGLLFQERSELGFGGQSGARAEGAALDGGDGVAQFQARLEICAGEQAVEKAAVKCVARAGRVATDAGRGEAWGFDKAAVDVDNRARGADRHAGDRAAVARLQFH